MHGASIRKRKMAYAAFARWVAVVCALFLTLSSTTAQDFPNRPLTFIIPLAAGGPADLTARIVAQKLSENLGQQVVIENIGGASGQIALNKVARARPDGHTLLFTVGSFLTVVPHLFPKANLDPARMFAPVAMLTAFPTMMVSSTKLPLTDLNGFIAYARSHPDKLNFASPGAGSNPHLAVEAIKKRLGVTAAHVPYRGGGPALAAVMAGDVDFACTEPSNLLAQMDSGQLRALAVADSKRHPAFPDVPTFHELGYGDLEFRAWSGVLAPLGTPEALIETLREQLWRAVRSNEVATRFATLKLDAALTGPKELQAIIQRESDQWKPLIEGLGLAQTE